MITTIKMHDHVYGCNKNISKSILPQYYFGKNTVRILAFMISKEERCILPLLYTFKASQNAA